MSNNTTQRQHVLPLKLIERFYGDGKNGVHLRIFSKKIEFFAAANNDIFVVNRKWDAEIEKSSVAIETCFQKMIDGGLAEPGELSVDQSQAANNFYLLISERSKARFCDFNVAPMMENAISFFDKNTIDTLEEQGVFMGGPDQMERAVRGLAQRLAIGVGQRRHRKWGVLKSSVIDFVVSDNYHHAPIIPVDSKTYLVRDFPGGNLDMAQTVWLNKWLARNSEQFYFAKNLRDCGLSF